MKLTKCYKISRLLAYPLCMEGENVILGESLASYVGFCDPSKDVAEHFVELWGLVVFHAQFPDGGHTLRAQSTRYALHRHRSA